MTSRWLTVSLVFGMTACGTWHGPGAGGGCDLDATDDGGVGTGGSSGTDDSGAGGGTDAKEGGVTAPDAGPSGGGVTIDAGTLTP